MSDAQEPLWRWKSWIDSANDPQCGFPLQNLPFCAFEHETGTTRLGVGIGDLVLDLYSCAEQDLLRSIPQLVRVACTAPTLNELMQSSADGLHALRSQLMLLLRNDAGHPSIDRVSPFLRRMAGTTFHRPVHVGDYTDFYASIHHATNVGRLFRPDQPLLPNYKFVPIGYHGRASSIVISGTPIKRSHGQIMLPGAAAPVFAPTRQLDYEVEIGAYIGTGNPLGKPIPIAHAEQHIFGYSLVNDWSARDIQAWEYQPLGPFLGKSFATTISPWVVPAVALTPFHAPLAPRAEDDPQPLPHLRSPAPQTQGIHLQVEAFLATAAMRDRSLLALRLSSANLLDLYWSFAQMVAHHTSNGCNLMTGDLLASGTISGPSDQSLGCLLEITKRGSAPLTLPTGETRTFLEDGDELILTAGCHREGFPYIALGECRGRVTPAET